MKLLKDLTPLVTRTVVVLFLILILAALLRAETAEERQAAFTQATTIDYDRVLAMYEKADTNHDGKLEWEELQAFTSWLVAKYKYKANVPALWPQEFLDQGGGDCEDWAGVTAGLCLYWGREAYIASFGKVTKNKHALVLVRSDAQASPYWLKYYHLSGFDPMDEFIPVDYDSVGHLAAIDRRWKIAHIYTPQQVWGAVFF